MDPSTTLVRKPQRKIKRSKIQKLNGPFKGKLTTSQILKIKETKIYSPYDPMVEKLSIKFNAHPHVIRDVITNKYFPVCAKLEARDKRIRRLFG
jgi:hypothetical protein